MGIFGDITGILYTAAPLVLQAEADLGDAKGKEKHAQVAGQIVVLIDAPGGIDFPKWVPQGAKLACVDGCITLLVFLFNKFGKGLMEKLKG